jgi:hypothetical protein
MFAESRANTHLLNLTLKQPACEKFFVHCKISTKIVLEILKRKKTKNKFFVYVCRIQSKYKCALFSW